ncbi:MAG TPA: hypothetical protein PKD49_06325 [Hyphomicrobium sp.]|nr:hypothetical protein [Hyphomicrobium sp.]
MKTPIDFLKRIYPSGPWVLTAIEPKKSSDHENGIETRTFGPQDEAACAAWITKWNGTRNLYWLMNEPKGAIDKKTAKTDMRRAWMLYVDLDPKNAPEVMLYEDQRRALLEKLTMALPHGVPQPSIILDSGGGYWGLWLLDNAVDIDGDRALAEDYERYNIRLEQVFGADNCHNVDRICRLPFTLNIPDFKKVAAGRTEATTASVLDFNGKLHPLSSFVQGVKGKPKPTPAPNRPPLEQRRINELNALDEWKVPDRVKVIIAQGAHTDPEEVEKKKARLGKDPSRSEWLFDVVCHLVRQQVPDELIKGIIMDPQWGISESVLELKAGAERYAEKQIATAHAAVGVVINAADVNLVRLRQNVARVLLNNDLLIFRQGYSLFRLRQEDGASVPQPGAPKVARGTYILQDATEEWLLTQLSILAQFVKTNKKDENYPVRPDRSVLMSLMDHPEEEPFKVINRVVRTPTLTRNEPGYDTATGHYLHFDPADFPPAPMEPTWEDADRAIDLLEYPMRDFTFANEASAAVAASAMICSVVRPLMRACPLHVFNAALPGSGKTKLSEMAGILALGSLPPMLTYRPFDEVENQKTLETVLASGVGCIVYDNVENAPMMGSMLNAILTNPSHTFRVLGGHNEKTVGTAVLMIATGNAVQIQGDLASRTVICTIEPKEPDGTLSTTPSRRAFDFDPVAEVRNNRGRLVMAALTVIRAFIAAGKPFPDGFRPMRAGTFDDYDMVRGALMWLGRGDPLATLRDVDDPQEEGRSTLYQALYLRFAGRPFVWQDIAELDGRDWMCPKRIIAEMSNRRGEWVPKAAQSVLNGVCRVPFMGLTMVKQKDRTGINVYKLTGTPHQTFLCKINDLRDRNRLPDGDVGLGQ